MVSTKITPSELATYALIGMLSRWVDGKATTELLAASAHPKMRVKYAYLRLVEVADAAGTTITGKLQNNGTDMTDTLTFTQGVEAISDVKAFTLVSGQQVISESSNLTVVTAGTTTTLGEVEVVIQWENTS